MFKVGAKAEALDEFGVWAPCFIKKIVDEGFEVSFCGWGSQWDRVVNNTEIRDESNKSRKRGLKNHSYKIPKISKMVAGDAVWLGKNPKQVHQVDPINEIVLVEVDNDKVWLPVEEFSQNPPPSPKKTKRNTTRTPRDEPNDEMTKDKTPTKTKDDHKEEQTDDEELDFCVYVRNDGFLFRVGNVCFVDSVSFPVLLTRIFRRSGKVFVSVMRCRCEDSKVVSFISDFILTVECSYVLRICSSVEYCVSRVSQQISFVIFQCQSRIFSCQERNFGNVSYQRELRRHALGAQIRQAVCSGISVNATRPAHPVSLGVFEPFHDMSIFGLSEENNFKISFNISGGFKLLDSLCGREWDVKPLRSDVSDCHFKFVKSATVYLDKKNLSIKFSFSFCEAPFCLCPDYREKCCNFVKNV